MTNEDLIYKAASVIKTFKRDSDLIGDVGCALISENQKVYVGVCASVGVGSFCAEINAIGSMITDGDYKISKIVATWKNEAGEIYVIPPCGHCREFIKQIHIDNLETEVLLSKEKTIKLKDLLPFYDLWQKID